MPVARPATGEVKEIRRKRGTVFAIRFRAYGERTYDPPHVRHLLLVLSTRMADERSDVPRARARGACVAAASPVRAEAGHRAQCC